MEGRAGEETIAEVKIFHLLGQESLERDRNLHVKTPET